MSVLGYDRSTVFSTLLGALCALSACSSRIAEPNEQPTEANASSPASPLGVLGATPGPAGKTRASVEDIRKALAPHLSRTGRGLAVERTRAGSQRIPLEGRFHSVQVAVRQPDGSTRVECVTSKGELDAVLARGAR